MTTDSTEGALSAKPEKMPVISLPQKAVVRKPLQFMDLSVDIKTLIVSHVCIVNHEAAAPSCTAVRLSVLDIG